MADVRQGIKEFPPSLILLYAQLLEQVGGPLPAVKDTRFIRRVIDGKKYWYRRVQLGQTRNEISLGRETDKLLSEIRKTEEKSIEAEKEAEGRETLITMLINGGANTVDSFSGRILALLENSGVFAAGGVLVGSHAFSAYGNMLGYKLPLSTAKTADIDLSISIGVSKEITDLKTAIMESGLGFFEVPAFGRQPTTSYKVRGKEFKIDLLTSLTGRENSKPVYINALKAFAAPLRFMDYLIKNPIGSVVVAGRGILVNIPQPSRFAVHKLVLSQRRRVSEQVKSIKDLNQAACLIEILLRDRPGDFNQALEDVRDWGSKKFIQQMMDGLEQLRNRGLLPEETIASFCTRWEKIRKK